jgi:nucleoside-diphosphate-sugar epimerase
MHILMTGAAGFTGQILANQLLDDPSDTVILTDVIDPQSLLAFSTHRTQSPYK